MINRGPAAPATSAAPAALAPASLGAEAACACVLHKLYGPALHVEDICMRSQERDKARHKATGGAQSKLQL